MKKLTIPLCLVAAATLAACGGHREVRESTTYLLPHTAISTATAARPGSGKVVYVVDPTGPVNGISTQRLTVAMSDGSSQVIEQRGAQIAMGAHVRIRSDNRIIASN